MTPEELDRALPPPPPLHRRRKGRPQKGATRRFPWRMHVCLTIPKRPGSPRQELHRDGDLSLLDVGGLAGVDHAISCIWALDGDFTERSEARRGRSPAVTNGPRDAI
uniref:Uncharacterized protein n=1 Tax=Odontella aurita TaxID=265563 RepID=A0A7S4KCF3_9STRA|mmetsp:Transcript_9325/g.28106  ORF Transcript_9325/g.28106 Transcript_9325/m.28106 type:complete len:107 (+) Transcript_9325:406-726(+)